MTYVYLLFYSVTGHDTHHGVITFTNKTLAIETARFYRDKLNYYSVGLRQDKRCNDGMCEIKGSIDF